MPTRLLATAAFLSLSIGCAAHDDPDSEAPKPPVGESAAPDVVVPEQPPEPEPEPVAAATVSIASVQLHEDCPDPKPAANAPAGGGGMPAGATAPSRPSKPMPQGKVARRAPGSGTFAPSCTQSTIQLAFVGNGEQVTDVRVTAVRLLEAEEENNLGSMKARTPTFWAQDSGYAEWDQKLPASTDVKASYKLGGPDWTAAEKALGGSSFGRMYIVEVDVEVGGRLQTARSAKIPRERPHRVVT